MCQLDACNGNWPDTMRLSNCKKCGCEIENRHTIGRLNQWCDPCRKTRYHITRPRLPNPRKGTGKCIDFLRAAIASQTDECILWPWSCAGSGYGQFGTEGKLWKAHVWVCTQVHGPRPEKKYAAHSCHQQTCVNPRHVSWKTNSENMLDKREIGTGNRCGFGPKGKLTPQQRGEILALRGKLTHREIANRYGIVESTVRHIQNGRCKPQSVAVVSR